jgi:dolichol kinase
MFDRLQQHASHPTTLTRGPRELTWRGVVAGFLLAAAVPLAVLIVSYPVPAAVTVVTAVAAVAGDRALRARRAPPDAPRRTAVAGVVDGD